MYGLGNFFVALVILFGQKKGVASIAGLVVTLVNVVFVFMPLLINTLVLAFVGASINSVVIYYMYRMPYISLMNTDFMAVEIVKGLVGSIAVVLSIPTAAMMISTYFRKIN